MEKINQARHIKTFRQKELDEKREREFFEEQKQIRLRQQENLKRIQGIKNSSAKLKYNNLKKLESVQKQEEEDVKTQRMRIKKRIAARNTLRRANRKELTESRRRDFENRVKTSTDQFYMNCLVNQLGRSRSTAASHQDSVRSRAWGTCTPYYFKSFKFL